MTTTTTFSTTRRRSPHVGALLQRQGALLALVGLVVFGALRYGERFATGYNVRSLLGDDAKYGLVALGGVVAIKVGEHGFIPGLLAGIAVGAGVGIVNAVLITKLRLQPFIVTLAMLLAARGLALNLAHTRAAVAHGSNFQGLAHWTVLGLPLAAWLALLGFLVGAGVLRYTAFGRQVLAVGGNEDAARLMGLPVTRVKFTVYVLSGALAGAAGVFLGSQTGSVDTAAGQGWELSAIAAVVVGGTLLTGGVGSVLSTLVGVLLLQLIFNLIVFENSKHVITISSYWESVIRGAFLLVVVLVQVRLVRRQRAAGRHT